MSLDVYLKVVSPHTFYTANVTGNLEPMADLCGIGGYLWSPHEIGITKAYQLIEPLRVGLVLLKQNPDSFKKLSPKNGWGTYEYFVVFVENYLHACMEEPTADIVVSK